ncbi:MAG: hypothetical protein ABSC17_03860 [Thermacetogeniaceae bacterium]
MSAIENRRLMISPLPAQIIFNATAHFLRYSSYPLTILPITILSNGQGRGAALCPPDKPAYGSRSTARNDQQVVPEHYLFQPANGGSFFAKPAKSLFLLDTNFSEIIFGLAFLFSILLILMILFWPRQEQSFILLPVCSLFRNKILELNAGIILLV